MKQFFLILFALCFTSTGLFAQYDLYAKYNGVTEGGNHDVAAVVITLGDGIITAGFAADDEPIVVVPAVVGRPKNPGPGSGGTVYIGTEALEKSDELTLSYPIQDGIVTNWGDMEKVLHQVIYNKVRVAAEEHPFLVMHSVQTSKADQEKLAEMFFEVFEVPALYLGEDAVMSLYASGRSTGIVLQTGEGVIRAVPIREGYVLPHGVTSLDMGGRDLTDYMMTKLNELGYSFSTAADREIAADIVTKQCYTALVYEQEMQTAVSSSSLERSYTLPSGQVITIEKERFRCPEVMFQPGLINKGFPGIHQAIYGSIMKCEQDLRKDLYANIVIAGRNTMFPGIADRLQREVSTLAPPTMTIKLIAPPERLFSAWIGGSIMASLPTFQQQWVFIQEYHELGPSAIHRN